MRILTVAAHPDDETLGAGGTMARLAAASHEVHVCILTEGVTARHRHVDLQQECAVRACEILGVSERRVLRVAGPAAGLPAAA